MAANNTKRPWKENAKEKELCKLGGRIKTEYEKNETKETGISAKFIMSLLRKQPNFIGIYSQDRLENISIKKLPITMVINIDFSNGPGIHWIAISIDTNNVEIYDSLGFNTKYWPKSPKYLLHFLSHFKQTHKFLTTPCLQTDRSSLCGFYCLYFLFYRTQFSFKTCLSIFTSNLTINDNILMSHLAKL